MKTFLYALLATGSLLGFSRPVAQATAPAPRTDSTAEAQRKAATTRSGQVANESEILTANALASMPVGPAGFKLKKAVTTPTQRARRLHALQLQLKAKALRAAKTRRARLT